MTTDLTSVRKIELTLQSLELQSLDIDSLLAALSSVEKVSTPSAGRQEGELI